MTARPTSATAVTLRAAATKRAAATAAYGPHVPPAALHSWLDHRAAVSFVAARIPDPDAPEQLYLLAEAGGHTLGGGLLRREAGGAYLADVYCHPPRTGAGTALTHALLEAADERDWGQVRAFVFATNEHALAFFASFGFTEHARIPNAELPGQLVEMVRPAARPA